MASTDDASGAAVLSALQKWSAYYAAVDNEGRPVRPPWESGGPASYVMALVEEGLLPPGARTVELGSGVAATSIHLARLGFRALAIDLVPAAIEQGRALERLIRQGEAVLDDGGGVEWVAGDMFTALPERVPAGRMDLVMDIQCLHIFPSFEERRRLADLIYRLLRPGGLALVVTGNGDEPPRVSGPPALTREEVLAPFLGDGADGRFRLRKLDRSRFDQTPAYGPTPPLCWVALFERV